MILHFSLYLLVWCFLRCVFALAHQVIIHSQETRAESQCQTRPADALVPSEVQDLQAELQDTLRALQQQQDPANILDDDKVHIVTFPFCLSVAFKKKLKHSRL